MNRHTDKTFITLYRYEGSLQISLNYGYFNTERQFGWPAPDEAWQARRQAFIGWPARNHEMFNKIPVHFFGSLRIPVHSFGSLRIPIHSFGS
jgi:hypothetical protein